jgi:hypothetical protein
MPILDYAQRETLAYMKEPTQQNLDKLHAKQNEEVRKRWLSATLPGLVAVAFAIPLYLGIGEKQKRRAEAKPCNTKSISVRGFYLTTRKGPMARTSAPEQ